MSESEIQQYPCPEFFKAFLKSLSKQQVEDMCDFLDQEDSIGEIVDILPQYRDEDDI